MTPPTRRTWKLLIVGAVAIGVGIQLVNPPGGLAAWAITVAMAFVIAGALMSLRADQQRR